MYMGLIKGTIPRVPPFLSWLLGIPRVVTPINGLITYNWVIGVISLLKGVITPLITGRRPPCRVVSSNLVNIPWRELTYPACGRANSSSQPPGRQHVNSQEGHISIDVKRISIMYRSSVEKSGWANFILMLVYVDGWHVITIMLTWPAFCCIIGKIMVPFNWYLSCLTPRCWSPEKGIPNK